MADMKRTHHVGATLAVVQQGRGRASPQLNGNRPLPVGWELIDFVDATDIVSTNGKKVKQRDYRTDGILPVVDQGQELIGGFTNEIEKKIEFELPVIVFGDHTRILKFLNFEFVAGADGVKVIRPLGMYVPKLLYYFLQAVELPDKGYSRHFQFLRKVELPLPPLPEQHRIVSEIETQFTRLDAGIAALKRVQANLKRYKASVLKAACEGRLVPTEAALAQAEGRDYEPADVLLERILTERQAKWEEQEWQKLVEKAQKKVVQAKRKAAGRPARIRDLDPSEWQDLPETAYARHLPKNDTWKEKYKEPVEPDTSELSELPEGWVWATWDQVGFSQNGRAFPSKEYSNEGVKLLRPGNLHESGMIEWSEKNTRYMPEYWAKKYPDHIVRSDELVMNLTAQSLKDQFLGRVCLSGIDEFCLLNQRIARISPILISPHYLLWMFKSEIFRCYVDSLNTGSLIQHMFTSQLAEFVLPLPPLAEQHRIVAEVERRLSVVAELEATVEANLKRAERLRQAILKQAFEGKLVPQDPEDEPAEVLLERIRNAL